MEHEYIYKIVKDMDGVDCYIKTGQIVRCKDCKHRDPEDKMCDCGHFIRWQLPRQDDWFCADGERREDEARCD